MQGGVSRTDPISYSSMHRHFVGGRFRGSSGYVRGYSAYRILESVLNLT